MTVRYTAAALALASCRLSPASAFQNLPRVAEEAQPLALAAHTDKPTEIPKTRNGESLCVWGPRAPRVLTDIANDYWLLALEEAGLDANSVSLYGCSVPKMPFSLVERVQALNHEKVHNFNFQGSYMWEYYRQIIPTPIWNAIMKDFPGFNSTEGDDGQTQARNWVIDFAKANFSSNDLLKITDADSAWKHLGPYDVSEPGKFKNTRGAMTITGDMDRGDKYQEYLVSYDAPYWQEMVGSNFTLCPGGDNAWSMRFYEAIMAGSIPVIKSVEYDLGFPRLWALWDIPYKYYVLDSGDELVYRQDWVDENLKLFIMYQTFQQGDLHPDRSAESAALAGKFVD